MILQNVRNYQPNDRVSHPRRLEFSFLLLILLKLPLIMTWALSYGIANVSVSVFIATKQKHSSKLVKWQCITSKKTVTMSRYLFTSWLTDIFQPIQYNTIGKKKTSKSTNDQLSEWKANFVALIQEEMDYRDRNVTFSCTTKQIKPRQKGKIT